jgi:hypothetical protein
MAMKSVRKSPSCLSGALAVAIGFSFESEVAAQEPPGAPPPPASQTTRNAGEK